MRHLANFLMKGSHLLKVENGLGSAVVRAGFNSRFSLVMLCVDGGGILCPHSSCDLAEVVLLK